MRSIHRLIVPVVGLALAACGSSAPSAQLVDARRAYAEAQSSQAPKLAPDRMLDAQRALARAEDAHDDDANSKREHHLAYLAHRKAQTAMQAAAIKAAEADKVIAEQRYKAALENKAESAEAKAETAEARTARMKTELQRTRAQSSQELAEKDAQLAEKEKARLAAEERARLAMQSLAEIASVKEEARGMVITLDGAVLFKTNQSVLLPIAQQALDRVAAALLDVEDGDRIIIAGHTDSQGSAGHNRELSRSRAEAVRVYLMTKGVAADRLEAIGKGEDEPVANNKSAEGRANNRRVEIIIPPRASAAR